MIILDTNVVSEPMKPGADPSVVAWLDRQAIDTLYLTATSLAELLVGVDVLPNGRRKDGLGAALTEIISSLFGIRVLPFDQRAATTYASLISRARSSGHAISMADGQIAAIAFANGFSVATRDSAPFLAAGVPVVNPWRE
jgi:predicted nucleic acid-binding protein